MAAKDFGFMSQAWWYDRPCDQHKTNLSDWEDLQMSSESGKPTLYERLGGVYSIAAVVDDFIDRVMHNQILNANAAVDEAHHRVSAAGFKYFVTEMVCWATGGPQHKIGP
jgi:hypothetical protein